MVPAEAEVVIEGYVDPDYLEPEGPFGESHGYVALEDYNLVIDVTAITRRKNAILPSIISQVTPSESSVVKRLAYEPMYLAHLRDELGIKGIKRVVLHEPLTNLRSFVILQFARGTPRTEVWRALHGDAHAAGVVGKFVIAVERGHRPRKRRRRILGDVLSLQSDARTPMWCPIASMGHGAAHERDLGAPNSALLIDATMKHPMPPLALPKTRIHGERQGAVGTPRPAGAQAGSAVVRLFARRLARTNGIRMRGRPRAASGSTAANPIASADAAALLPTRRAEWWRKRRKIRPQDLGALCAFPIEFVELLDHFGNPACRRIISPERGQNMPVEPGAGAFQDLPRHLLFALGKAVIEARFLSSCCFRQHCQRCAS